MRVSRLAVTLHLLLFVGVLAWIFANNHPCLLMGLDGQDWQINQDVQAEFHPSYTEVGADPLQGSFDGYFPAFREYLFPNAIASLFTGGNAGRTLTYIVYAVTLALSTYLLAAGVGFGRGAAALAGMVVPFLTMPVFLAKSPLLYGIFELNPYIAQSVALMLLMLAAFWSLEDQRGAGEPLVALLPICCTVIATLSLISITVLMVPPLAVYGTASLFSAPQRRRVLMRLAAAAAVVVVPLALGMLTYLYGLSAYTAFAYFSQEFVDDRMSLIYASVLYQPGYVGVALIAGGMAGALYALRSDTRRLRVFSLTHLIATACFQAIAYAVVAWAPNYHGPSPVYFEIFLWPISAIFCAYLAFEVIGALARAAASFGRKGAAASWLIAHLALAGLSLYLISWNLPALAAGAAASCPDALFSSLRPTPITARLTAEIGLKPGATFRGSVATFTGFHGKPAVDWLDLHGHDGATYVATGNDYRMIGLWKYRIPTLLQYSNYITPQYYRLFSALLDRPQDRQMRGVVILTKPNERILKLWGVRFLITDFNPDFGTLRLELPVAQQPPLRLIELNAPDLGDYSPTQVEQVGDFSAAIAALRRPNFNGRHTVVVMSPIVGPLVPATVGRMALSREGLRVTAESAGRSVLVLPVQYSHCWTAAGQGNPRLFRANFAQLGVSFEGSLDASLKFRYGPILAGGCRLADLADMDRFNIRAVPRTTPVAAVPQP